LLQNKYMSNQNNPSSEKELKNYLQHLADNFLEIEKIETKLTSIIRRNSIVDIAAKVEVYQLMLDRSFHSYLDLKKEINDLVLKINHDNQSQADKKSEQSIQKQIGTLPETVANADRRFEEVKFHCDVFINETLK